MDIEVKKRNGKLEKLDFNKIDLTESRVTHFIGVPKGISLLL